MQMMDYSNEPRRDILCIDVKSFFASVEAVERHQNPLKARIAVVSRPQDNGGLVLASSPEVKARYGIRTGSRLSDFPRNANIEVVPPRMSLYLDKNIKILLIFLRYVSEEDLHIYSIDEAFLDVTHSHLLFGTAESIALRIQKEVWEELGLVVTVGIGDNPLLAKLALDHEAKKDRLTHYIARWRYEDVPKKVWAIKPLSEFWGIGKKTEDKLKLMGIQSIYDLSQINPDRMKRLFGVIGEELFYHAHGIDRTILSEKYAPKAFSFSKNHILRRDYTTRVEVEVVLQEMLEEIAFRLRKHNKVAGVIHVGIGYSKDIDHPGFSRQWSIEPTNRSSILIKHALSLFRKFYEELPVRVVHISLGKVQTSAGDVTQLSLFDAPEVSVKETELDRVRDDIRKKYGYTSLLTASSLLDAGTARYRANLLGGHASGQKEEDKA